MANARLNDETQSPSTERKPGFFGERSLGLVAAVFVFGFALLHEPAVEWSDQVFGLDESALFGLIIAAVILVVNEIWVRWIQRRLSGLVRVAVIAGFAAPIGYVIGDFASGFRVGALVQVEAWVLALSAAEIAGLALGGLFILSAIGLLALLGPKAREADLVSRHEQRQLGVSLPIMLGEGVLLILLVVARQLDWSAPGAAHGSVLFIAGAAFLAAIWFSVAIYGTLDELERNLFYRQTAATFLVYFFVLAAWALAEAMMFAPVMDAFTAFLVLNAVYLAVATPWSIWHSREELKTL